MSITVSKNQKKKTVNTKELKKYIDYLLDLYGINGKYTIPNKPDFEGDYFIVIYPKKRISINKAIDISTKMNIEVRKKFGENIYIDIIPK